MSAWLWVLGIKLQNISGHVIVICGNFVHLFLQDVLQCMLKAQQTADDKGRALTDDEITAQSVVLMAAGYGTASTTLALICYNLALYPDAQGQLYNEIRKYWPDDDRPDYDIIQKMLYLDQVICETLRLYPPGKHITCQLSLV